MEYEDDETVMYLFVNNDLGMGKGKIAAQVGHTVQKLMEILIPSPTPEYKEWKTSSRKIVLKATESQLRELIENWKGKLKSVSIYDAGCTQIPDGSLTVVGFYPLFTREVPKQWKLFKLL